MERRLATPLLDSCLTSGSTKTQSHHYTMAQMMDPWSDWVVQLAEAWSSTRTNRRCRLKPCSVSGEVFSAFTDADALVVEYVLVADHSFHAEQREAHSTAPETVVEPEGQPMSGSLCSIFYT